MTSPLIISVALVIVVVIISVLIIARQRSGIKELEDKTNYAVKSNMLMRIENPRSSLLTTIAGNFNSLIQQVQNERKRSESLTKESERVGKLDSKLKEFEESISQVQLLTDIGTKITASLDLEAILKTLNNFISSSMDVVEIELVHLSDTENVCYSIDSQGTIRKIPFSPSEDERQKLLAYCISSQKEVQLNDAQADYGQYVDKPISSLSDAHPQSVICIPLVLHSVSRGAISILSDKKDAYNSYHLSFLRGIASYVSVALDNSNVYEMLNQSKEEIEKEKKKSDELLLNILPEDVAEELKLKGNAEARKLKDVTVLFSDFENFTGISESLSPEDLVKELNIYFKAFDGIMDKYGLEKIKTIGDAYMAAGGMSKGEENSIKNVVLAALDMQDFIRSQNETNKKEGRTGFNMRVGIHSGDVVAGIVGARKFQYDIWGDTVNTASRMESSGEVNKVNISESTHEALKSESDLDFTYRGEVKAKHKGAIKMYFVNRK